MNKVSKVKQSLHKEKWLSIIKECQFSGMTIRAWCQQNNIKEATYYRNLQKLRSEICEQLPIAASEPEKPVVFQPLQVETPIPDVKPAVIIRRGDTTIEINSNAPKETVEAVLIALASSC